MFPNHKTINRELAHFPMKPEVKSILKQCLEHRSVHHFDGRSRGGFGIDHKSLGIVPNWKARNSNSFGTSGHAAGELTVRELDHCLQAHAGELQSPRSRGLLGDLTVLASFGGFHTGNLKPRPDHPRLRPAWLRCQPDRPTDPDDIHKRSPVWGHNRRAILPVLSTPFHRQQVHRRSSAADFQTSQGSLQAPPPDGRKHIGRYAKAGFSQALHGIVEA